MESLFKKIDYILCEHECLNKKAMSICQAMGYNGFKRLHRVNAKKLMKLRLKLATELFDRYRETLETEHCNIQYTPVTLKAHLADWDSKLETSIKTLGELNKEYYAIIGMDNCIIEKALKNMCKCYEKTGRWYKRFEETDWLAHDMHVLDDCLHCKYKEIEGEK